MADSYLLGFSVLLLIVGLAHAQVFAPNCSASSLAWSLNSLGQGPCLVAAYLAAQCHNGAFTISALLPQSSYVGPNGQDDGDLCKCNTVEYNLVSACAACQGATWINYSAWTANCSSVATARTFPEPIPSGTRVPNWAYLDPTPNNTWGMTTAQLAGDSPEVTGSAPIGATSTTDSQSTGISRTTSSSLASSKGSTSSTGFLKGSIVGAIGGAALITGVVLCLYIRRRCRALSALSAASIDDQSAMGRAAIPCPSAIEKPRLYDPSDPSTYPTQVSSLMTATMNDNGHVNQADSTQTSSQPNQSSYKGLPEV